MQRIGQSGYQVKTALFVAVKGAKNNRRRFTFSHLQQVNRAILR